MKDLYRLAGLKPFEDSPARLSQAAEQCENPADREVIKGILCVPERKAAYDHALRTVSPVNSLETEVSTGPAQASIEPATDKAPTSANPPPRFWAGFVVLFLLVIGVAVIVASDRETDEVEIIRLSDETSRIIKPEKTTQKAIWEEPYHVTAEILNLRNAPGVDGDIVFQVKRFDDLQVEFPLQNKAWAKVTTKEGTEGYVSINFIGRGQGASAYRKYCSGSITRPGTGVVFQKPGAGRHSLNLEAPASYDISARLIDDQGQTVLSGYVRAGETHRFDDIASGNYGFRFAIGQSFSADCGLFIENMALHESEDTVHFDGRLMDNNYVYSEMSIFVRE